MSTFQWNHDYEPETKKAAQRPIPAPVELTTVGRELIRAKLFGLSLLIHALLAVTSILDSLRWTLRPFLKYLSPYYLLWATQAVSKRLVEKIIIRRSDGQIAASNGIPWTSSTGTTPGWDGSVFEPEETVIVQKRQDTPTEVQGVILTPEDAAKLEVCLSALEDAMEGGFIPVQKPETVTKVAVTESPKVRKPRKRTKKTTRRTR